MTPQELISELGLTKFEIHEDNSITIHEDVVFQKSFYIKKNRTLPIKIRAIFGNLDASKCFLNNLNNFPECVVGNVNLSNNYLQNLIGCPQNISGDLICSFNPNKNYGLSFKGCAKIVCGSLIATNCQINNLTDIAESIHNDLNVSYNNLKTLGGVKYVGKDIRVTDNKLISLEGIECGGKIYYDNNPISPNDELERNWW
jgi:hypothetical protein